MCTCSSVKQHFSAKGCKAGGQFLLFLQASSIITDGGNALLVFALCVRDKSNLNIGCEIIRKNLGFLIRTWALRSVRVVAFFYGREGTELVSIWFVFQFYLALYVQILYFYFSFHRSSWKSYRYCSVQSWHCNCGEGNSHENNSLGSDRWQFLWTVKCSPVRVSFRVKFPTMWTYSLVKCPGYARKGRDWSTWNWLVLYQQLSLTDT